MHFIDLANFDIAKKFERFCETSRFNEATWAGAVHSIRNLGAMTFVSPSTEDREHSYQRGFLLPSMWAGQQTAVCSFR